MSTTSSHTAVPATRPTLLEIASEGPVKAQELGQGFGGVLWIVQPEDFPTLIEHINRHGGPSAWRITPTDQEPVRTR